MKQVPGQSSAVSFLITITVFTFPGPVFVLGGVLPKIFFLGLRDPELKLRALKELCCPVMGFQGGGVTHFQKKLWPLLFLAISTIFGQLDLSGGGVSLGCPCGCKKATEAMEIATDAPCYEDYYHEIKKWFRGNTGIL